MAHWQFWTVAAALTLVSLGLVFMPLWRGAVRADWRASYDI
jgi:cytochrome c-type biogenesis protein CcmH/NrfG